MEGGKEGRGREKQRKGTWQGGSKGRKEGRNVYRVEECPQNTRVHPEPQNVALLGSRVFAH